jgi:metallo-beta-lactamase family protein
MKLQVNDAVRNVTGTKHLLTVGATRVLLDCGFFQGRREESDRRNRRLAVDPAAVDAVVLSHAHIDHSGSLPTLVKRGYRGRIFATNATVDLAEILLRDTAHIQAHDIEYINRKRRKKGETSLEPIYEDRDVDETIERFVGVDYDAPTSVARDVTVTFRDAGHILGSSILEIDARERGRVTRVVFTGDLGRRNMPILRDPYQPDAADVLITESTYGNRSHSSAQDVRRELASFISEVARRRGKIVVPAFAVGRTQRIVYILHELMREASIPEIPVFVDSPLAVRATEIYERHPECFDEEMNTLIRRDDDPLGFSRVTYVKDVGDSKKLNRRPGPAIIISASGMCEAGRVLHHLKNTITRRRNAVMIVGYQAEHTLGRRIVERAPRVRIFGKQYPLRARVKVFNEFSAHADQGELTEFATSMRRSPRRTVVVHGSTEQSIALARALTASGLARVTVPFDGEEIEI